jgi:predicted phosphoribosyltransferase
LSDAWLDAATQQAVAQLAARRRRYRAVRPTVALAGRSVLLVDQAMSNGDTMGAAIALVRRAGAARVVAAAPCGATPALAAVARVADAVVCVTERPAIAPHDCFEDARQIEHDEVVACLSLPGLPPA